ncbi:MAG TPA: M28 family peptidase, partial [Planctomycetota bacterium]|nr:M28 family peptidase [Planctomycetota bacterium]
FKDILNLALAEADGDRAFDDLVSRWMIDRWFTFTGMLKSCEYSAGKMREYGFDEARVEKFPADGKTTYGTWRMPYAWDATDAKLTVVSPESDAGKVLAHYRSLPCSLAMWSAPTPKKGVEGEVVALEKGSSDADYKGLNVRGKFILTNLRGSSVRNQAIRRGALAVISDTCRWPFEMPDAVDWMNAWSEDPSGWGLTKGEKNIPGFQISHRQGQALRRLIRAKGPVRLKAVVDAKVYAGVMPVATGAVRGRTTEEVITLGHGAEQGANDNASGCACMLEGLRVIRALIAAGKLRKPKRGIRLLITWEIYATLAFVQAHRRRFDRTVAGLCMDMVGEKQSVVSAPLGVHKSCASNAAYTDTFMRLLAEELWTKRWPFYRWAVADFGLTDCVIADPSIGVPTTYLGQGGGGDHNWHTNEDTPDKVDPKALKYLSAFAATFLYFLADAGEKEAAWLAEAAGSEGRRELASAAFTGAARLLDAKSRDGLLAALSAAETRFRYLADVGRMSVDSAARLAPGSKRVRRALDENVTMVEDAMIAETEHIRELAEETATTEGWSLPWAPEETPSAEMKRARKMIVRRRRFGPLAFDGVPLSKRKGLDDGRWGGPLMSTLMWCDGRRTLAEAMRLASGELGRTVTGIVPQIKKCEKLGLVTVRKA